MKRALLLFSLAFVVVPLCADAQTRDVSADGAIANEPPVFTRLDPPRHAAVNSRYTYTVQATDPEGSQVRFAIAFGPPGMTIDTDTGTIEWLPRLGDASSIPYVVSTEITDGAHVRRSEFTVRVDDAVSSPATSSTENLPPVFVNFNPLTTATATELYVYTVVAQDPEGMSVTYALRAGPQGMSISSESGEISWVPTEVQATSTPHLVTIEAFDGVNIALVGYAIIVRSRSATGAQNLPPTFVDFTPPTQATATTLYSFTVRAVDPEGEDIAFSLLQGPQGMSIGMKTGRIQWVPLRTQARASPYPVTVAVSDGTLAASAGFTILVNSPAEGEGNLSPFFENFNPPREATATEVYTYTVRAKDPEGEPVTFGLEEGPQGMSVEVGSGTIEWVPTCEQATSTPYAVTVSIADGINTTSTVYGITVRSSSACGSGGGGGSSGSNGGGGGGGGQTFGVPASYGGGGLVPNLPPVFVDFSPPRYATATLLYSYVLRAKDPENNPLTFGIASGPPGMSVEMRSGYLAWVPTIAQATTTPYAVEVTVSDGQNTTRAAFEVVVNTPAITVPLQPAVLGQAAERRRPALKALTCDITFCESGVLPSFFAVAPDGMSAGLPFRRALLFAGLLNLLDTASGFVEAHWCVIVTILWFLTLGALAYARIVYRRRRTKRDTTEASSGAALETADAVAESERHREIREPPLFREHESATGYLADALGKRNEPKPA